jgi:hypothetical protein
MHAVQQIKAGDDIFYRDQEGVGKFCVSETSEASKYHAACWSAVSSLEFYGKHAQLAHTALSISVETGVTAFNLLH